MLKFNKGGKKLMEMDEKGNITFHDEEFKRKMKEVVQKEEEKGEEENDEE